MKIQKLILKYGIFLAISLGLFLSFNCLFSAPLRADQEQVNILPIEGEPGYFAATTDGRSSIYVVCAVSNAGSPGGDELRLIKSPDFGQTWEEKQTVSVCNKIGNMVFDVGIDRFRGAIYVPVLYQRKLPGGGYYCDVALYQSMDDGKSFEKNENLPSERFYTPCPIKGNETVKSLVDPKNGSVVLSIATPCSERNNRVYATKTENGSEFSPWEEIAAQEEPAREGPLIKTVTNEDGDTFSIVYEKTAGKSSSRGGLYYYKTSGAPNAFFIIDATASAGGNICPDGKSRVRYGGTWQYSMCPEPGYDVQFVMVDGYSHGKKYSHTFYNITANHSIYVQFDKIPIYLIDASAGLGGSISPSGRISVGRGGDKTFTITPESGYYIKQLMVNNRPQPLPPDRRISYSYSFYNVTANHRIEAYFEKDAYGSITAGILAALARQNH